MNFAIIKLLKRFNLKSGVEAAVFISNFFEENNLREKVKGDIAEA